MAPTFLYHTIHSEHFSMRGLYSSHTIVISIAYIVF